VPRIEFHTAADFKLEACEIRAVAKTLREIRVLGQLLHTNMVDTLLLRLVDAVELRCLEILRRKQGTYGDNDESERPTTG
jgi:hypothetical protein